MSDPDNQINLPRLLRELGATASAPTNGLIEDRLRIACRLMGRQRQRRRYGMSAAGLAACLLLGLGWEWRVANEPPTPPEPNYAGFMALPYAQSDVPMEQAVVVRVNMQPADLAGLGLPPALLNGRNGMRADLLIGQDGIARAVRLTR